MEGYPPTSAGKRAAGGSGHHTDPKVGPIDDAAANENAPNLAEVMSLLEKQGYTGQMAARPGGCLLCFTCHRQSDVSDVEVEFLRRTEGASDPDDMLAVVALTCPLCATRATAVLGYGPEASEDDAEVLLRLQSPRER
ncbi:MAG TPA: hypothetical protein VHS52_05865 [Acidimicrobiales bacterium]|nr:hypothetical protein [Acidimicrobiales bacterium]